MYLDYNNNMRFEKHDNIIRIYEEEQIGSVEMIDNYIENIFLSEKYRGQGYLRKIIEYLGKPLTCLPLPQHIEKFKHLGFRPYKIDGDDIYYIND